MNIDSIKVELIDCIAQLNDQQSINKILSLKKIELEDENPDSKIFGSGKLLVEFAADDFNNPLDLFKEYQK